MAQNVVTHLMSVCIYSYNSHAEYFITVIHCWQESHSFLTEIQEVQCASLQLVIRAIEISCCNATFKVLDFVIYCSPWHYSFLWRDFGFSPAKS